MSHPWLELPRPFYNDWSWRLKEAGHALWHWHLSLLEVQPITGNGTHESYEQLFEKDQQRALHGEPIHLLREPIWRAAYQVCEEHELSRKLLSDQIGAAKTLLGPLRFEEAQELDVFIRRWAVAHTRLLAGLVDATHTWQIQHVDELARGFFFVGRLMSLADDLERDQLFIPLTDLEQAHVDI